MLSEDPSHSAASIAELISRENEGIQIQRKDVLNERAKIFQAKFGPRSATQQFLHELEITDGTHYRLSRGPDGRINRIFWTYQWNIDLLRRFPGLLSVDNTYKVNRFNMPLFQATGITCLGTSFQAFYCLVSDETEASYTWVLDQYRELIREYSIPDPFVIITDFDQGLKNAAKNCFPNTQQQICVWHIMKNVVHNIKKKWNGPLEGTRLMEGPENSPPQLSQNQDEAVDTTQLGNDDIEAGVTADIHLATQLLHSVDRQALAGEVSGSRDTQYTKGIIRNQKNRSFPANADGILSAWEEMVYAITEDDFISSWITLQEEFQDQPSKSIYLLTYLLTYLSTYLLTYSIDLGIITYLQQTYIPVRLQFATYSVKNLRNYGLKVTSRTEGSHADLKRYLKNRLSTLQGLHREIINLTRRKQTAYIQAVEEELNRRRYPYQTMAIYQEIKNKVSKKALQLIHQQYIMANDVFTKNQQSSKDCTHSFQAQYGLPCAHVILDRLQSIQPLQLRDIDQQWHLQVDTVYRQTRDTWLIIYLQYIGDYGPDRSTITRTRPSYRPSSTTAAEST